MFSSNPAVVFSLLCICVCYRYASKRAPPPRSPLFPSWIFMHICIYRGVNQRLSYVLRSTWIFPSWISIHFFYRGENQGMSYIYTLKHMYIFLLYLYILYMLRYIFLQRGESRDELYIYFEVRIPICIRIYEVYCMHVLLYDMYDAELFLVLLAIGWLHTNGTFEKTTRIMKFFTRVRTNKMLHEVFFIINYWIDSILLYIV